MLKTSWLPITKKKIVPVVWRNEGVSRFVLGTAQLGMKYGICNSHGQPDEQECLSIVETAWNSGIRFFDTAQAYQESEKVLGGQRYFSFCPIITFR